MLIDHMEIRSTDHGSVLAFSVIERTREGITFECQFSAEGFAGRVICSTYLREPPSRFFASMAYDWRSRHVWQDLEGGVTLRGSTDSVGHVEILVELRALTSGLTVMGPIHLELGQMGRIVSSSKNVFGFDSADKHREWTKDLGE